MGWGRIERKRTIGWYLQEVWEGIFLFKIFFGSTVVVCKCCDAWWLNCRHRYMRNLLTHSTCGPCFHFSYFERTWPRHFFIFFSRTLPGCAAGPPCPPRLPAQMVSGYKDQVQPSLPRPLLLSPPPGQPRSGDELPGGSNIPTILCAYCLARVGLHWRLNSNQASFCGWPRDKVTVAWDFRFSKSDMVRTSEISSTSKIKIISLLDSKLIYTEQSQTLFFCLRSG